MNVCVWRRLAKARTIPRKLTISGGRRQIRVKWTHHDDGKQISISLLQAKQQV